MISRKELASILSKCAQEIEYSVETQILQEKSATEYIFEAIRHTNLNILSAEYVETFKNDSSKNIILCRLRCEMDACDFFKFPLPVDWAIDTFTKKNYANQFSVDEKSETWNITCTAGFAGSSVIKRDVFFPFKIKNINTKIASNCKIKFQFYNIIVPNGDGYFYFIN